MHELLTQTGYDIKHKTLEINKKFYYHCQIKGKTLQHFKFTLKKDIDFNHTIIINQINLNGKPVFHVVDAVTVF